MPSSLICMKIQLSFCKIFLLLDVRIHHNNACIDGNLKNPAGRIIKDNM